MAEENEMEGLYEPPPEEEEEITISDEDLHLMKENLWKAEDTLKKASEIIKKNSEHFEIPHIKKLNKKVDDVGEIIKGIMNEFDHTLMLCYDARTEINEGEYTYRTTCLGISNLISNPEAKTQEGVLIAPLLSQINSQLTNLHPAFANFFSPTYFGVETRRVRGGVMTVPVGSLVKAVYRQRTQDAMAGVMQYNRDVVKGLIPTLCSIIEELSTAPKRLVGEVEELKREKVELLNRLAVLDDIKEGVDELCGREVVEHKEVEEMVDKEEKPPVEEEKEPRKVVKDPVAPKDNKKLKQAVAAMSEDRSSPKWLVGKREIIANVNDIIMAGVEKREDIVEVLRQRCPLEFQNEGVREAVEVVVKGVLEDEASIAF